MSRKVICYRAEPEVAPTKLFAGPIHTIVSYASKYLLPSYHDISLLLSAFHWLSTPY